MLHSLQAHFTHFFSIHRFFALLRYAVFKVLLPGSIQLPFLSWVQRSDFAARAKTSGTLSAAPAL
jgi:hypothetical protein